MIGNEKIIELFVNYKSTLKLAHMFIVDLTVSPNEIVVYLDSFKGLEMENCEGFHRFLQLSLEPLSIDVPMTVSSPGLTSSLKVKEQYLKNIGKQVQVVFVNGLKVEGELATISSFGFEISTKKRIAKTGTTRKKAEYVLSKAYYSYQSIKTIQLKIGSAKEKTNKKK